MKPNLHLSILTLAGLLAGAAQTVHAQNLLLNGSFETGDFTGWTHSANVNLDSPSYINAYTDPDGTYYALFNDTQTGTLDQHFATTPGQFYSINFWVNDNYGGSSLAVTATGANLVSAGMGGSTLLNLSTANDSSLINQQWQDFSYTVRANGTSVDLMFAGSSGSFMGVDNVMVTVPEPSMLSMVAGIGALGFAVIRRRQVR